MIYITRGTDLRYLTYRCTLQHSIYITYREATENQIQRGISSSRLHEFIMRGYHFMCASACFSTALGAISWTLEKSANPSQDESSAYERIEAAMTAATARHQRLTPGISKTIRVYYSTGVPTAEANFNGDLRFGADAAYQTERTALHEIAHTLGVGQRQAFNDHCDNNDWPTATPLLQSWDGGSATISCGGGHFWPYGLNFETEWSDEAGDRHCLMVEAMLNDGMAAY